jgi:hypothetical protein
LAEKRSALKRRIAQSVPLALEYMDESGAKGTLNFRLCFNFNVGADIREKTGLRITELLTLWAHAGDPGVFRAMLWASILPLQPEWDTVDEDGKPNDEGLETIGSYMDEANSDAAFEALWSAYLLYLAPKKREAAEQWMAEVKAKPKGERENLDPLEQTPTETPASPSTGSTSGPLPDMISASPMASSAS